MTSARDPMTDEQFLSYVEAHSRTERHLFSMEDALRLLRLSGSATIYTDADCAMGMDRFVGIPEVEAERHVRAARKASND